jgi:hypothetical protein
MSAVCQPAACEIEHHFQIRCVVGAWVTVRETAEEMEVRQ